MSRAEYARLAVKQGHEPKHHGQISQQPLLLTVAILMQELLRYPVENTPCGKHPRSLRISGSLRRVCVLHCVVIFRNAE